MFENSLGHTENEFGQPAEKGECKVILVKDFDWIYSKRQKLYHELKIIKDHQVQLLGVNTKIDAKKLKEWQLKLMNQLETRSVKKLLRLFHEKKSKMCVNCQDSIWSGDLKCRNDLKNFIICDTISKSILNFWSES